MKSKDIRTPGIETAIQHLRPGATFFLNGKEFKRWDCPNGSEPPTFEEIAQIIQQDVDYYNRHLYVFSREEAYGDWKDQLEMLYKDIKSGNLENGSWVQMIDQVKQDHPKPD